MKEVDSREKEGKGNTGKVDTKEMRRITANYEGLGTKNGQREGCNENGVRGRGGTGMK